MLYDPKQHEPLVESDWDEAGVRQAIQEIVSEAATSLGPAGYWPIHPLDSDPDWQPGVTTIYAGAAGVIWALGSLAASAVADVPLDLPAAIDSTLAHYRQSPDYGSSSASLWMGETGIVLVAHGLTGDAAHVERLLELVRENAGSKTNEVMWGAPGTMLAASTMLDRTGDTRFTDAWAESAERLWAQWGEQGLWTQTLYGKVARMLGPAHGMAGNVRALAWDKDFAEAIRVRTATALEGTVERTKKFANWPAVAGKPLAAEDGTIRTQWCHGAPGIVASLWDVAPEELMIAGGELTWKAGPLAKGPGLCHGTAGNGYAFLKLFALTGNELWLTRARAFALHALAQVSAARRECGRGRFTLFTGDVGAALYARSCLEATAEVPTIDAW